MVMKNHANGFSFIIEKTIHTSLMMGFALIGHLISSLGKKSKMEEEDT